jgi:hypothetical protein
MKDTAIDQLIKEAEKWDMKTANSNDPDSRLEDDEDEDLSDYDKRMRAHKENQSEKDTEKIINIIDRFNSR